jgi:hypothetical protein
MVFKVVPNSGLSSDKWKRLAPMNELDFDSTHWYLPADDLLGFIRVPAGKFWK